MFFQDKIIELEIVFGTKRDESLLIVRRCKIYKLWLIMQFINGSIEICILLNSLRLK